jgi:hypothetical protein
MFVFFVCIKNFLGAPNTLVKGLTEHTVDLKLGKVASDLLGDDT